ncbi:CaiB/BaiF CoA transferase family protein [Paraburkholderia sp. D1E]|uniref:CaiB/BaiF CoA transferase family protein n=1 Tax=Paraburkholderia sp. D1E TaxID=3461398 RepID=UPI0040454323
MAGPLEGIKVVEMVGIGPAPFCGMMLADMGAEVIRIDQKRVDETKVRLSIPGEGDVLARGRRSLAIDLKNPGAIDVLLHLIGQADALIEGYRPGVMERLGLGPDVCMQRNERIVYGRMTGWGQTGPLASAAGHDINYIALSGALHPIGRPDTPPVPPLNYVGDFGGGAMLLAFGVVCALLESRRSGNGQVIDAAMTDGSALLAAMIYGMKAAGVWTNRRGTNLFDGGAHFYDTYVCADQKYISIGPIEARFYVLLLDLCGIDDPDFHPQLDVERWPALKQKLAIVFGLKTRAEWCSLLEGTDVCFAPVLDLDEAPMHPHNQARGTFVTIDGVVQPAPAPRFSRTPPVTPRPSARPGEHTESILADWGVDVAQIQTLKDTNTI